MGEALGIGDSGSEGGEILGAKKGGSFSGGHHLLSGRLSILFFRPGLAVRILKGNLHHVD